jgi:hypothetical protein
MGVLLAALIGVGALAAFLGVLSLVLLSCWHPAAFGG